MLSRLRISAPQYGHRDRGETTDSFFGTRSTTTVRKLPTTRPNGSATSARIQASLTFEPYRASAGGR